MNSAGPSGLAVRLLDGLDVARDGEPVPPRAWARRKARELLALLCVQPGRSMRRDRAAAVLWPDTGARSTALRLRVTLHALNEALEPDRPPRAPTRYVHASAGRVRLDPAVWVDLDRFDDLARRSRQARDPDLVLRTTRAALALYRGPLLARSPEVEWARPLRDAAQATFVDLALRGGAAELAHGDAARAAGLARSVLAVDPYRETAYRLLAEAQLAAGDAAAARPVLDFLAASGLDDAALRQPLRALAAAS